MYISTVFGQPSRILSYDVSIHAQERDDAANHSNQHGDGEALPYPSAYKLVLACSLDFTVTALFHSVKMFTVKYTVISECIKLLLLLPRNISDKNGIR